MCYIIQYGKSPFEFKNGKDTWLLGDSFMYLNQIIADLQGINAY